MSKRTWPRACFCRRYREAHSEAAPSCCQRASRRRQRLLDTGHLRPHLHRCWLGAAPGSGQPWPPQATTQNCWGLPLRAAPSSGSAWPGPTDHQGTTCSPGCTAHGAARGRSYRLVETQRPPGSSPITPGDSGAKPEQGAARPVTSAPEQRVGTNVSQTSWWMLLPVGQAPSQRPPHSTAGWKRSTKSLRHMLQRRVPSLLVL